MNESVDALSGGAAATGSGTCEDEDDEEDPEEKGHMMCEKEREIEKDQKEPEGQGERDGDGDKEGNENVSGRLRQPEREGRLLTLFCSSGLARDDTHSRIFPGRLPVGSASVPVRFRRRYRGQRCGAVRRLENLVLYLWFVDHDGWRSTSASSSASARLRRQRCSRRCLPPVVCSAS